METAIFGAGCFWGVEASFQKVNGIIKTTVGYSGGNFENPTYNDVCGGTTGHTEVVQIEYDPTLITYEQILTIFWNCHTPTLKTPVQYRSVIFYHSPQQEASAKASKQTIENSNQYSEPLTTSIEPAKTFYPAEEYHQKYLEKQERGRV